MAELNYQMMKAASQARETSELKVEHRRRNLLMLIMQYFADEGYVETMGSLGKECNLEFSKYEVCDNVDLETVLMEYESFYYVKFQKYPKIVKKVLENNKTKPPFTKSSSVTSNRSNLVKPTSLPKINGQLHSADFRQKQLKTNDKDISIDNTNNNINAALSIQGRQEIVGQNSNDSQKKKTKSGQIIDIRSMINQETRINVEDDCRYTDPQERLLKPLGGYGGYSSEWRELAVSISKDIYLNNPDVKWDDIVGLESAKQLIKEAVVYPIKYPKLFQGILSPWKGILLYGPPGTGKTMLAKAVATECNTTFFNISASSIVSKWRGDSEKLVRILFELARYHAPSTIFIDELESVMSQRGSGPGSEHEGSRRMKTELLIQMDGLSKSDDLVFLLAASNIPWDLDHAMLRRLEKRILVGLPSPEARTALFQNFLPARINSEGSLELRSNLDYIYLSEKTEGYSGSDIKLVCKEAAMKAIRKIFHALETHKDGEQLHIQLDPITTAQVMETLSTTKPSAKKLTGKYDAWQTEYESV